MINMVQIWWTRVLNEVQTK